MTGFVTTLVCLLAITSCFGHYGRNSASQVADHVHVTHGKGYNHGRVVKNSIPRVYTQPLTQGRHHGVAPYNRRGSLFDRRDRYDRRRGYDRYNSYDRRYQSYDRNDRRYGNRFNRPYRGFDGYRRNYGDRFGNQISRVGSLTGSIFGRRGVW